MIWKAQLIRAKVHHSKMMSMQDNYAPLTPSDCGEDASSCEKKRLSLLAAHSQAGWELNSSESNDSAFCDSMNETKPPENVTKYTGVSKQSICCNRKQNDSENIARSTNEQSINKELK